MKLFLRAVMLVLALAGCKEPTRPPLAQRAYVWQRVWTSAVAEAVTNTINDVDAHVIFGGEVVWTSGQPQLVECDINWETLRQLSRPVCMAMRIAPYPGPFDNDAVQHSLTDHAKQLLARCANERLSCAEFQIDFDCAQKKLDGYALWLRALREVARPCRFVITTLPAWLGEASFPRLLREVDSYVLQVHSVRPAKPGDPVMICDPERAHRAVAAATQLRVPFEVALPTYSALVGLKPSGEVVGYSFEGPVPKWPADTQLVAFDSDAAGIAGLVREWKTLTPASMHGVIWYRLPITTDVRNWPLVTWRQVKAGEQPVPEWHVQASPGELVDFKLSNVGTLKTNGEVRLKVTWEKATLVDAEALPGFLLTKANGGLVIESVAGESVSLSPGAERAIGWARFNQRTQVHVEVSSLPVGHSR
ncbi:MAG: DUF3142 domain-containing protein [Verrucomicrobiaceae bacterium]|nr:DUF3142 domain-containing protein [Verrucomicrobiaceae bacterium]